MLAVPLPEAERHAAAGRHAVARHRQRRRRMRRRRARPATSPRSHDRLVADEPRRRRSIPLAAAAHSSMLDPVLAEFLAVVESVELSPPTQPYLSNSPARGSRPSRRPTRSTGSTICATRCASPRTCASVLADGPTVFIELGPGHSLSSYARRQETKPVAAIPALRHPNQADRRHGVRRCSRSAGAGLPASTSTSTVSPATAGAPCACRATRSARERHWIEPGAGGSAATAPDCRCRGARRRSPPSRPSNESPSSRDCFSTPAWIEQDRDGTCVRRRSARGSSSATPPTSSPLPSRRRSPTRARPRPTSTRVADSTPTSSTAALDRARRSDGGTFDAASTAGSTTARLRPARSATPTTARHCLAAVTRGAHRVDGPAPSRRSTRWRSASSARAPREYDDLRTALVDVAARPAPRSSPPPSCERAVRRLRSVVVRTAAARRAGADEPSAIARPMPPTPARSARGGNYLVTGGLGGVGFVARPPPRRAPRGATRRRRQPRRCRAGERGRVARPPRATTTRRAGGSGGSSSSRRSAPRSRSSPPTSPTRRRSAPRSTRPSAASGRSTARSTPPANCATGRSSWRRTGRPRVVLGAKARGALTLVEELQRRGAELLVLSRRRAPCSTPEGQAAYVAANSVLDALAGQHGDLGVVTDQLRPVGRTSASPRRRRAGSRSASTPASRSTTPCCPSGRDATAPCASSGALDADHHWLVDEHRSVGGHRPAPRHRSPRALPRRAPRSPGSTRRHSGR